jgi:hypothetical protein
MNELGGPDIYAESAGLEPKMLFKSGVRQSTLADELYILNCIATKLSDMR